MSIEYSCKNWGITLIVLLIILQLYSNNIWARPTTQNEAEKTVKGWLKCSAQPLGVTLGRQITKTETYTDDTGNPIYYIVYLQTNGFVIVSADDLVEPIIGFVQEGVYDPSPDNPLGALVTGDLNNQIESVRSGKLILAKSTAGVSAEPQSKWNKFIGLADASEKDIVEIITLGISTIDDVRVAALMQTKWGQTTCCMSTPVACYNYYTPIQYNGQTINYPCGCVATALAQIMRYHQWPSTGIGYHSFTIEVSNPTNKVTRYTRGGDGAGGAYDWTNMPTGPGCGATEVQRQAIGALCYDAGVAISNRVPGEYTYYNCVTCGGTTAYTHSAKLGLTNDSNGFHYGNAIFGYNGGSNIDSNELIRMVNPNLDSSLPVYLGIKRSSDPNSGHAIVCDGYGYNTGTMYHHLNMGWGLDGTAQYNVWYHLPTINSSPWYDTIRETIYNIYILGSGEIMSGRVTDPAGNPISDVNVHQKVEGPNPFFTCKTNAKGMYHFRGILSDTNFAVWADNKSGYIFGSPIIARTGKSEDSHSYSGNLWGVDIACLGPDVNTMTPTFGPGGTYMKIQGTHFGTSTGQVIFPGVGYYGTILQWSDTLIRCRVPFNIPSDGNVIVRSSIGVNSTGVFYDVTDPNTIYVDSNHTPDIENGSTSYPFSTIQRGIDAATYQDNVIVRPGTYSENINFGEQNFTLTGTDPNDPDIVASTVIDGGGNGTVVTFTNNCSTLTGFTVTNGISNSGSGGGIYCTGQCEDAAPTISHCVIAYNNHGSYFGTGGGIYCYNNSPTISYCIIAGNEAGSGGGVFCQNDQVDYSPKISHCLFIGNTAINGGGLFSLSGSPIIRHCGFSKNLAYYGGGISSSESTMMIHHSILWADLATYGPEINMSNSANPSPPTIKYSDVQGGLASINYSPAHPPHWDANSNINTDPMFVRDPNPGPDGNWDDVNDNFGDLHLIAGSPCIGKGDPNLIPASDANTDMDGQPRIVGSRADIGADEFVYPGDINFSGDVDFQDIAIFAAHWQNTNCGKCSGADLTGDSKVNWIDLRKFAEWWLAGTGP